MSKRTTQTLLHDLAHHAGRIRDTVAQAGSADAFLKDARSQEAVLWNFVVLGEVTTRLGEPFHDEHPQIPLRAIVDQRNVVAHGYDGIDWPSLLVTISRDIPVLIKEAERLLVKYGPPPRI